MEDEVERKLKTGKKKIAPPYSPHGNFTLRQFLSGPAAVKPVQPEAVYRLGMATRLYCRLNCKVTSQVCFRTFSFLPSVSRTLTPF